MPLNGLQVKCRKSCTENELLSYSSSYPLRNFYDLWRVVVLPKRGRAGHGLKPQTNGQVSEVTEKSGIELEILPISRLAVHAVQVTVQTLQ